MIFFTHLIHSFESQLTTWQCKGLGVITALSFLHYQTSERDFTAVWSERMLPNMQYAYLTRSELVFFFNQSLILPAFAIVNKAHLHMMVLFLSFWRQD